MVLGKYRDKFHELGIPSDVAVKYAENFNGKIFVVKGGGEIVTNQYTTAEDLVAMHYLGIKTILVHGGKERINKKLRERNLESKFIEGYRITTPEILEVVDEALDEVNEELRREIREAGGYPLGLKEIICAAKHKPVRGRDLELVGEPRYLREGCITPIAYDHVLVVSPVSIAIDGDGRYNSNADSAARCVAAELNAEKLIYLTDMDGVIIDGSRVSELTEEKAEEYISQGHINGGMLPKVRQATEARKSGVKAVHIINGKTPHALLREIFSDEGIGTMVA